MERRDLLKGAAALALSSKVLEAATPSQMEGPFHPLNLNNDLRRIGNGPMAAGQQIRIHGQVTDSETGAPLPRVHIELWQADSKGKYNHPGDTSPKQPDPNFQFWSRLTTDSEGRFAFYSIKPGAYGIGRGGFRTPHIHFHFSLRGFQPLTTQMYFHGEPLNSKDGLLNRLSPEDQEKLVVRLKETQGSSILTGTFPVELDPV